MSKALGLLMTALGIQSNCAAAASNAELADNVLKIAEKLKANGKLTGKQFESLAEMDEEQRGMVGAILGAMGEADKAAAKAAKQKAAANEGEEEEEEEEEEPAKNKKAKAATNGKQPAVFSAKDLDALIDKRVTERVEAGARAEVVETIKANSANTFDDDELKGMSLAALQKYEKSLRPVDYSGQGGGGFSTHREGQFTKRAPLLLNSGVLSPRKEKEAAKA